jgi:Kef-type K+ transport system membrane component KefB
MTDTTAFFVDLFILLTSAVVAGEVARRLGQVALVGQLLVGVILGPTLLGPYIGLATLTPELSALQFLGTVFILFMAGLDVVPEQITRMGARTALMGVAIFAIPFAALSVAARFLFPGSSTLLPLFLGLTLSITALPVMGIMLVEFGLLKTRLGNLLLNTALINELTAVTVFAVLLQLQTSSANGGIAIGIAVLSAAVFLGTIFAINSALRTLGGTPWWVATRERLARGFRTKEAGFAFLLICVIGASLYSQYLGLTFVVGAFYAGMLVTRESAGPEAHRMISGIFGAMTWGFFVPLFFAFVGVQMNLRLLLSPWEIAVFVSLAALAVLSKVGTGFSVARFNGWSRTDSLAIGHLVSSRGAVELAMAVILLGDGVFTQQTFTLVAGVGLVTTFIAPIAASRLWRSASAEDSAVFRRLNDLRGQYPPGGRDPGSLSFRILDTSALDPADGSGGGRELEADPVPKEGATGPEPPHGPPPLPKGR